MGLKSSPPFLPPVSARAPAIPPSLSHSTISSPSACSSSTASSSSPSSPTLQPPSFSPSSSITNTTSTISHSTSTATATTSISTSATISLSSSSNSGSCVPPPPHSSFAVRHHPRDAHIPTMKARALSTKAVLPTDTCSITKAYAPVVGATKQPGGSVLHDYHVPLQRSHAQYHSLPNHLYHPRRRRLLSLTCAGLLRSKTADVLTQSLFLSTLFGAACILLPIFLLYLYLSYFVAMPVVHSSRALVRDPVFGSTRPILSPLNATLHRNLASPLSHRNIHRELEHSFSIPVALSERIPTAQRYLLLSKLQAMQAHIPAPRVFILHAVGPSADRRLRAIAAALTYARHTDRVLLVLWDTAHAPGGDEPGRQQQQQQQHEHHSNSPHIVHPLADIQDPPHKHLIFGYVHSLHLSPNISHWTDYSISYFTSPPAEPHPLDNVAKLATRHIFFRSDTRLSGKYTSLLPGLLDMSDCLAPVIPSPHQGQLQIQGQFADRNGGNRGVADPVATDWAALVHRWTFPLLGDAQVSSILNRVYFVPFIFLQHMTPRRQRMLLHLLDRSKSKRALFVHVQYGMGNRLRALGSALALSRVTGRVPVLIWEPDVHLNCSFHDLFVSELVIVDAVQMSWPPRRGGDHAMTKVDFFNFMRNEGKGRHDPTRNLVNPRQGRHVYAKSAYVIRSSFTPRILSTRSKYWKIMREELVPRVDVMLVVLDPMFANIDEMVGVHIRARTIDNDIKGVGHETYGAASKTTDQWRKRTGLKTFEEKIRRLSLKYKYFVAADMKETIEQLELKFGKHRIYSIPRQDDCAERDVHCAKMALADILLLSKVSTLLGSHWSSFSESAVRFSGTVKLLLAGVHFG